ncbi:MAG TPA: S24/S26 family peptidase [Acidimicrobiales bacterium]
MASAKHRRGNRSRRRLSGYLLVISLLAGVGAWWLTFAPRSLGGPGTYVVVSGKSMLPLLHTGDLVIAHKQSQYHLGEIVVVSVDGGEVIHRLWAGNAKEGWKTKGINKLTPDLWTIENKDVLGTKWLVVPHAGGWVRWAGTATGRSALAAALALFVVLIPRRGRRKAASPALPALRRSTAVLNSALLLVAASGGALGGLAGLDASVVGLRGWVRLPLTHLDVHPVLLALLAVVLLAISLPLIGLQVGRAIAERRRHPAPVEPGSANEMENDTGNEIGKEMDLVASLQRVPASAAPTLPEGIFASNPTPPKVAEADEGRHRRLAHRRGLGMHSLG